jgi:hypothetical protein
MEMAVRPAMPTPRKKPFVQHDNAQKTSSMLEQIQLPNIGPHLIRI